MTSRPRVVLRFTFLLLFLSLSSLPVAIDTARAERYAPSKWNASRLPQAGPFASFGRYRVPAQGILLKDLNSGRVLYQFDAERRQSPASLTKIMTSLIILEQGRLDDYVTVSREAAAAHKIRLRLRAGQVFRLEDLVKAMLITSANDACLAAAQHVGGTEAGFVQLMNEKAVALGLRETHFSNACGFDALTHYTTPTDLAILSEVALQNPLFRSFVREEMEVITSINTHQSYLLRSTNRLLGRLPGVEGVKTGFTSKAGRCLIAKVSRDGKDLLLVLLHANQRWNTALHLINYGLKTPPANPPPSARLTAIP